MIRSHSCLAAHIRKQPSRLFIHSAHPDPPIRLRKSENHATLDSARLFPHPARAVLRPRPFGRTIGAPSVIWRSRARMAHGIPENRLRRFDQTGLLSARSGRDRAYLPRHGAFARQNDVHGGADIDLALDDQLAAMQLHEMFRKRKPKPGAFVLAADPAIDLTEGF